MRFIFVLTFLFFISSCGIGGGEKGTHRGVITDVSYAGWFCKTWEGQIQTNGNSAMHYNFTITNLETVKALQVAQQTGKEVIVEYESPVIFSLCSSSNSNFVTGVQPINPEEKNK